MYGNMTKNLNLIVSLTINSIIKLKYYLVKYYIYI